MTEVNSKYMQDLLAALAVELRTRIAGRMVDDKDLGEKMQYASSGDLMAALSLLKHTGTTLNPEVSQELKELQEALASRRRRREPDPLDALAEELSRGEGD